jgi:hypothetical protein
MATGYFWNECISVSSMKTMKVVIPVLGVAIARNRADV